MPSDTDILDDVVALAATDASGMLDDVASAGEQVRLAAAAAPGWLGVLQGAPRPRAVVVAAMGGSAVAGDVLVAVAGAGCPVPLILHRGYGLPGWVGSEDLVVGVSCSGSTAETLSGVAEATRRGARLLTIGAPASPLAAASEAGAGQHVPVDAAGRQPRAAVWSLAVPLVLAAEALQLTSVPPDDLAATARRLESIAQQCRPERGRDANPAKVLARRLVGGLPVVWGSGPVATVAAYRFACQLNENAKSPAIWGFLPEAGHNQVVAVDGPMAGGEPGPLRLVLLRDDTADRRIARYAEVSAELARSAGVPVTEITAAGAHPLERLASLVGITDFASVYAALALGVDPTPIAPITKLKEGLAAASADVLPGRSP